MDYCKGLFVYPVGTTEGGSTLIGGRVERCRVLAEQIAAYEQGMVCMYAGSAPAHLLLTTPTLYGVQTE